MNDLDYRTITAEKFDELDKRKDWLGQLSTQKLVQLIRNDNLSEKQKGRIWKLALHDKLKEYFNEIVNQCSWFTPDQKVVLKKLSIDKVCPDSSKQLDDSQCRFVFECLLEENFLKKLEKKLRCWTYLRTSVDISVEARKQNASKDRGHHPEEKETVDQAESEKNEKPSVRDVIENDAVQFAVGLAYCQIWQKLCQFEYDPFQSKYKETCFFKWCLQVAQNAVITDVRDITNEDKKRKKGTLNDTKSDPTNGDKSYVDFNRRIDVGTDEEKINNAKDKSRNEQSQQTQICGDFKKYCLEVRSELEVLLNRLTRSKSNAIDPINPILILCQRIVDWAYLKAIRRLINNLPECMNEDEFEKEFHVKLYYGIGSTFYDIKPEVICEAVYHDLRNGYDMAMKDIKKENEKILAGENLEFDWNEETDDAEQIYDEIIGNVEHFINLIVDLTNPQLVEVIGDDRRRAFNRVYAAVNDAKNKFFDEPSNAIDFPMINHLLDREQKLSQKYLEKIWKKKTTQTPSKMNRHE